jgi:hypothetical protein
MDDEQQHEEQVHDATQREASRAGLVVDFFMVLLAGVGVLAAITLWPLFKAVPVPQSETTVQE